MKIVDEREMQKNNNNNIKKDRKNQWETKAIVKGCELNDFVAHVS